MKRLSGDCEWMVAKMQNRRKMQREEKGRLRPGGNIFCPKNKDVRLTLLWSVLESHLHNIWPGCISLQEASGNILNLLFPLAFMPLSVSQLLTGHVSIEGTYIDLIGSSAGLYHPCPPFHNGNHEFIIATLRMASHNLTSWVLLFFTAELSWEVGYCCWLDM